jgi:hypothetical protein
MKFGLMWNHGGNRKKFKSLETSFAIAMLGQAKHGGAIG